MKWWIGLLGLWALSGCGHMTDPKPLEIGGDQLGLKPVSQMKGYRQGDRLRVDWELPQHEGGALKADSTLYFSSVDDDCRRCGPVDEAWVKISVAGELLGSEGLEQIGLLKSWRSQEGQYSVLLPSQGLGSLGDLLLRVQYQDANGQASPSSRALNLHQSFAVPQPEVLGSRWIKPGVLSVRWNPLAERSYQELDAAGGMTQKTDVLGLLLYTDEEGQQGPVQPQGMVTGLGEFGPVELPLWVRFQDRFGNLSDPVPLHPQGP